MRFRAPVIVLAALFAEAALAICPAGSYNKQISANQFECTICPAGQYTSTSNMSSSCSSCAAGKENTPDHTSCVNCPAGKYSTGGTACQTCADGKISGIGANTCSPCPAGKQSNPDHTQCVGCPAGQYSPSGGVCQVCPAGKGLSADQTSCTSCMGETYSTGGTTCLNCPAGTDANPTHTGCDKCPKGYANGTPGGQCKKCDAGTFNNVLGATKCCDCCAGFYSTGSGNTSCTKCNPGSPYSSIGSNESSDCKSSPGGRPNPATSCTMVADNVCPNPTGGPPQGTAITRKRALKCTNGLTSCPRFSGRGGFDCVDTENDPESCGGCLTLDGDGSGTDCTAIQGNSATRCVKGSCVIDSCRKGWVKSLDGTSCVLASRSTGSPAPGNLHSQDTNAKKVKRSPTKRGIRRNIF